MRWFLFLLLIGGCSSPSAPPDPAGESIVVSIECLRECEAETEEAALEAYAEFAERFQGCDGDPDCQAAELEAFQGIKTDLLAELEACELGCRGGGP